ncbi:SDR family oxidoreductase [Comamonas piscis]|uniref:SDR family oxidoreductase n=1 Tax=Comamonas piscis TaxID=1562974 RepID=A0A7G5EKU0_9BURK|nr:SDR family oxidoreductase [Comamonas piscis]QMV74615.1 SDR family oxidoreductase [Comamonas piscis]WSO33076.1 SDR family oxidoreductase [Comamonas piscis]
MKNLLDKVILITGASSGIGEATAKLLAAHGATVVLGARRVDKLGQIVADIQNAGSMAEALALDVTQRAQLQAFADHALARHGRIDAIINNAGVMPLSPLAALRVEEWDWMIDVNIRGVLHGIAAVLPSMRQQGFGHVVNIASIGAHAVSPTAAVYCATKYAVWAISEGLRQESSDIRVTTISPGVTESELAETITDAAGREEMKAFRKVAISASAIARAIHFAISQPADVDTSEIIMRPTASPH